MTRTRFPILLTLFAFAIRLWRLDAQSLRGDEAFDVLFASQSLGEIIYQLRFNQIYPPLYHTLDHFWLMLAGHSQLSARFIALCAGVLLVPVGYRLAKDLFGERVARLASVLVAVHPFLIWHSQDGRMYTLLALCVALAAWFAVRVWAWDMKWTTKDSQPSDYASRMTHDVLYTIAATLAITTHYFAYFAIFTLNVVALYWGWRRRWPPKLYARWFILNVIVGLIGLMWIALAWARFSVHTADWIAPTSPLEVLRRSLLAYSLGTTITWERAWPFVMVMLALAVMSVYVDERRRTNDEGRPSSIIHPSSLVVASLVALPLILIYLGSLWRPMYDEKFLIFIVPFYIMLVARGLVVLRQWQVVGALVIITAMSASLQNYHFDTRFAKAPPWRAAAQVILSQSRAGDLVIYNFPDPSLLYQVDGALPMVLLPAQATYSAEGAIPLDAAETENALRQLSEQYERIWFVPQPSPNWDKDGAVGRWLSRFADRDQLYNWTGLTLERYLTPRAYQKIWTPLNAQFADGISLIAYRISQSRETIQLTLYWQASATPSRDYSVFAHLLDASGVLRAQQDNPPVNGDYPTSAWKTNAIIVDRYAIIIPRDLPAGRYQFEVGLYDANRTRLRVGDDDKVVFGEVIRKP